MTGGSGFLESHTAIRLKEMRNHATVIGRSAKNTKDLIKKGIFFHSFDIQNKVLNDEIILRNEIIIHCTTLASPFGKKEGRSIYLLPSRTNKKEEDKEKPSKSSILI